MHVHAFNEKSMLIAGGCRFVSLRGCVKPESHIATFSTTVHCGSAAPSFLQGEAKSRGVRELAFELRASWFNARLAQHTPVDPAGGNRYQTP